MVYKIGTKLVCNGVVGIVVENIKLPSDVCVKWEGSEWVISYDREWLDDHTEIVTTE